MTDPMKPRWFRFSLRTFFVLLTLVACSAWWLKVQLGWIRDRHDMLQQNIHWFAEDYPEKRPQAPWSLRLFGEPGVVAIGVPYAEHGHVQELFPEAEVRQVFTPNNSGGGGWGGPLVPITSSALK